MNANNKNTKIRWIVLILVVICTSISFFLLCNPHISSKLTNFFTDNVFNTKGIQIKQEKTNFSESNAYADYSDTTDQEFANFIKYDEFGIKQNILYSSASPINSYSERSNIADKYIKDNKIHIIINLEDNEANTDNLLNHNQTYTSKQDIICAPIDEDIHSEKSKKSIKEIFEYIAKNNGPFAFICNNGASKCSKIISILQMLNASNYDYIKVAYYKQYFNLTYKNKNNLYDKYSLENLLDENLKIELSNILNINQKSIIYSNLTKYNMFFLENECDISPETINNVTEKVGA